MTEMLASASWVGNGSPLVCPQPLCHLTEALLSPCLAALKNTFLGEGEGKGRKVEYPLLDFSLSGSQGGGVVLV